MSGLFSVMAEKFNAAKIKTHYEKSTLFDCHYSYCWVVTGRILLQCYGLDSRAVSTSHHFPAGWRHSKGIARPGLRL